jgi:hypothetical protein
MVGKRQARQLIHWLSLLGLDPVRAHNNARAVPRFLGDLLRYRQSGQHPRFPLRAGLLLPMLSDYSDSAGGARGHYFHQDLWAARKIYARRPREHVDIGSRIDGFIAHVLTFMPVKALDVRPLASTVEGLTFVQADATDLSTLADCSVESLSSLHAVEHFGLGRYGDAIAPDACFRAMRAMMRVLSSGGRLYFSVPIGRERLQFNAHRVFAPSTILDTFSGLQLLSFSAVNDSGDFHPDASPEAFAASTYACGMFEFTRP